MSCFFKLSRRAGWLVGKSDFNENPVVSQDFDFDFDLGFVNDVAEETKINDSKDYMENVKNIKEPYENIDDDTEGTKDNDSMKDDIKEIHVKVYTSVEFTNLEPFLSDVEVKSIDSIMKSRDHLRRNVTAITYGDLRSFKEVSGEFRHFLSIVLDVDTSRLWEGARSYIFNNLGRDSWTVGNGTQVR